MSKNVVKEPERNEQDNEQINKELLNNDLVQALMSTLNITSSINDIIINERKLFVLTQSRHRTITINNKQYKKRSINYNIRQEILEQYEAYETFKNNNPSKYNEILQRDILFMRALLMKIYGLADIQTIKGYYEELKPIVDGEIYKIIDNIYSTWSNFDMIIDNLNTIITQQKMTLRKELEKLNDKMIKLKEKELDKDEVEHEYNQIEEFAEDEGFIDENLSEDNDEIKENLDKDGNLIIG